jgi:hypothetical protein
VRTVVLAVSALALTACGAVAGSGASGTTSSPTGPTTSSSRSSTGDALQDPARLVGSWIVSDAHGADAGTVLRIADDLSLWQGCGYLMGGWRASATGLFAGHLDGGDGACAGTARNPTPSWLQVAAGYVVTDDGIALLDRDGRTVARLRAGGRPTPGPNLLPSLADPPVLDARLRAAIAAITTNGPIPTSLPAARRSDLLGAWVTVLPRPSGLAHLATPGITFHDDGSYEATDGCNGTLGGWSADDAGSLTATGGFSTLIGCDNVDVAGFAGKASWAAMDHGVLVLIAADGTETGRLRRP